MANGWANASSNQMHQHSAGRAKRWALLLAVGAALGLGTTRSAQADQFFDWLYEQPDPAQQTYVPTPTLNDQTVTQVAQYLVQQQAEHPTQPLAVKVRYGTTLSQSTVNAIYGTFKIQYTFADFEGPGADTQAKNLVNQIRNSAATGPLFQNNQAFVGNYNITPIPNDPTAPAGSSFTSGNSSSEPYYNSATFASTGLNMVNEVLYPGDASFRNPVAGTNPNIRSALFTLPIMRLANNTSNLGTVSQHIPYVSRFNNSDNPALQNSTSNGQGAFDTAGSAINGLPAAHQLLSRNDFSAMVLHYRMRGATGYNLLDPGVVGYTEAQEQADAHNGWVLPAVQDVLSGVPGSPGRPVPAATSVTLDGATVTTPSDQAGVIWSAVANDSQLERTPELAILVSNLSETQHKVTWTTTIDGKVLSFTTPNELQPGTHTVFRFTRTANVAFWQTLDSSSAFDDPALSSRDGVGIPEPTSLALLGLGGMGVLMRRRRKA